MTRTTESAAQHLYIKDHLFNVLFMYVMTFLSAPDTTARFVPFSPYFNYYSLLDCPFCTMCLSACGLLCERCDQLLDSFILYSVSEGLKIHGD